MSPELAVTLIATGPRSARQPEAIGLYALSNASLASRSYFSSRSRCCCLRSSTTATMQELAAFCLGTGDVRPRLTTGTACKRRAPTDGRRRACRERPCRPVGALCWPPICGRVPGGDRPGFTAPAEAQKGPCVGGGLLANEYATQLPRTTRRLNASKCSSSPIRGGVVDYGCGATQTSKPTAFSCESELRQKLVRRFRHAEGQDRVEPRPSRTSNTQLSRKLRWGCRNLAGIGSGVVSGA
jgi:hypothetical protein